MFRLVHVFFLERWDMDVTFLILCTIGEYEALGEDNIC